MEQEKHTKNIPWRTIEAGISIHICVHQNSNLSYFGVSRPINAADTLLFLSTLNKHHNQSIKVKQLCGM